MVTVTSLPVMVYASCFPRRAVARKSGGGSRSGSSCYGLQT